MSHLIETIRDSYSAQTTLGKVYINEVDKEPSYFCESLEDTVRPEGIKVYGDTAIPADLLMNVDVCYSNKFKRDVLVIYTHKETKNGVTMYYIRHKGVEYGMVYYHGGNDHGDTLGCCLVAQNRTSEDGIYKTMEGPLFEKVVELMKTCEVKAIFRNLPQAS